MYVKNLTPANLKKLAHKLVDYLVKNDLQYDVNIYVAGQRWDFDKTDTKTPAGNGYHVTDGVMPSIEYANPDTITMTFEGPLYGAINYGDGSVMAELDKLFKSYGLYLEQGHAWSMAAYKI